MLRPNPAHLRGCPISVSRSFERPLFERFTDRARRVVVLAQEEARMLDHIYIGTEHVLLGLIHEGRCRRNDVTIGSTSPILSTVDRSIIALAPFSAATCALYERGAMGGCSVSAGS